MQNCLFSFSPHLSGLGLFGPLSLFAAAIFSRSSKKVVVDEGPRQTTRKIIPLPRRPSGTHKITLQTQFPLPPLFCPLSDAASFASPVSFSKANLSRELKMSCVPSSKNPIPILIPSPTLCSLFSCFLIHFQFHMLNFLPFLIRFCRHHIIQPKHFGLF